MSENTNQKKVVTLEALNAVAPLLATKAELADEVKKQIEELPQEGIGMEFATTEEVLALFQKSAEDGEEPAEDGE